MAQLVYVLEESRETPTHESELFDIDAAGFCVDMSAVYVEHGSCTQPAASRPAFQRALRRLQAGDTLVTTKLWSLGNSVADVIATLGMLAQRQVAAVCLAYGQDNLCADTAHGFVQALHLADELERVTRRSRARQAATSAKERGIAQGRPSSLTAAQQHHALMSLGAGLSVTEIARSLNTSRQTIMRLRDANRLAQAEPSGRNAGGEAGSKAGSRVGQADASETFASHDTR
jgi:putative DNA-invertase from lambdoid prophage Rac